VAERKSEMGNLAVRLRDELYRNGCGYIWLERNWKEVRILYQRLQQYGKKVKCRENEKTDSPSYKLKDEIRPGRKYYFHCCNMNDRIGIEWIRMGVWKLLVISGGAGKEGAPCVKKKRQRYSQR
jgi:hypothetical protein